MSMMGDPSDDSEENAEEYDNYLLHKEELQQKKQEKIANPKKSIK